MMRRGLVAFGAVISLPLALASLQLMASPSLPLLSLVAVALGALAAVLPVASRA
jgi:hypothetical protein